RTESEKRDREAGALDLVEEDVLLDRRTALATERLRPADAEPAVASHPPERLRVEGPAALGPRHLVEQSVGHDLAEVRAQLPDEGLLGVAVVDEHASSRLAPGG